MAFVYLASILLVLIPTIPLFTNYEKLDKSGDTAINDFYSNVWEYLPEDSIFLTSSGVFGYDAFYWQLVYETRSDVTLPTLPGPEFTSSDLLNKNIYANVSSIQNKRGPRAISQDLINSDSWITPVLIGEQPASSRGNRSPLILYQISDSPPDLYIENPSIDHLINESIGRFILLGIDVENTQVESGDSIEITLYWQSNDETAGRLPRVETSINELTLEQHEIGFGLMPRYVQDHGPVSDNIIQETYTLIIPSDMETGLQDLSIHPVNLDGSSDNFVSMITLEIINEEKTFERWLRIASN